MKGTFIYDEKTRKITLKRDDGARVGAIPISLPGDSDSTIFSHRGEEKQYAEVDLWTNNKGECVIATATRAPCYKSTNWGKWCAKALAIFVPLSNFGLLIDPYLVWVIQRLSGKPQPLRKCGGNYCNSQQKYKRPKRGAFIPEFLLYWSSLRYHALRGWLSILGILIGVLIGYWLFSLI